MHVKESCLDRKHLHFICQNIYSIIIFQLYADEWLSDTLE